MEPTRTPSMGQRLKNFPSTALTHSKKHTAHKAARHPPQHMGTQASREPPWTIYRLQRAALHAQTPKMNWERG